MKVFFFQAKVNYLLSSNKIDTNSPQINEERKTHDCYTQTTTTN